LIALAADPPASVPAISRPASPAELRKTADDLEKAGKFKEALDVNRKLALDPALVGAIPVQALTHGLACLQRLNLIADTDAWIESVVAVHPRDWRVLQAAAASYRAMQHSGFIVGGQFTRGWHRGNGRGVNTGERDRIRALQLLEQARLLGADLPDKREFTSALLDYVNNLQDNRTEPSQSWRLQVKTDLPSLPDWDDANPYTSATSATSGAPVDENENPVLHAVPPAFLEARSDGERIRWLLDEAARCDPSRALDILLIRADFLNRQFGVETLADQPMLFHMADNDADTAKSLYALDTLGEQETLARLATGIKRFPLPPEHNPILLLRRVAEEAAQAQNPKAHEGEDALNRLAQIFENRRQYPKAADCWRTSITRYGPGPRNWKQIKLDQIVNNWGVFEPVEPQTCAQKPTVEYRYRNGNRVTFEAKPIDVPRLLLDIREHLKSNPRELDWNKLQLDNLGWRLVQANESRYIGAVAAEWALDLKPRENHFDRRVTASVPLTKPGAYWLTARMDNGNTSHIILWLQDSILVQKPMGKSVMLFLADAETGAPIEGAAIDCFGYRNEWKEEAGGRSGRNIVITDSLSAKTDDSGIVVTPAKEFNWLYTATTPDGRFAFLGFSQFWWQERSDPDFQETRTYVMTDRPVYRPGQTVKFKVWVSPVRYDLPAASPFAGKSFKLLIQEPQGNKILETNCTADAYGGIAGEITLGGEAMLGVYSISLPDYGGSSFRVEEYKKPEFEVKVDAPADPVALGDAFKATITARYYFGAPVSKARVNWKVVRNTFSVNWFPPGPWDWLYGSGYGWLASDYPWYPGWDRWGCFRPFPWWRPTPFTPPEVIAENTVDIGPDGTVQVPLDTALAKALFGNTDHEYTITAEVTDDSRRTIVGSGRVIAAREPFKVYAWTHRGFYRAGETILASFSARRPDGKPVSGKGRVRLLKLTFKDEIPIETVVQEWPVEFGESGDAVLQLTAALAGQYRLSATVTGPSGREIEGACLVTVRGERFTGAGFRFNGVEVTPDKATYAKGEKASFLIQADRLNGAVLFFVRPVNGVYTAPEVIRLAGKSALRELTVESKDMPNFFVEALSVHGGNVYVESREILVPPEQRVLNVSVEPASETCKPGVTNRIVVKATTLDGKPALASLVLTVYDKAVEYISGGSNVPEIKEFFWKWRRSHTPITYSSADRESMPVTPPKSQTMGNLGLFGESVADAEQGAGRGFGGHANGMSVRNRSAGLLMKGFGAGSGTPGVLAAAAPMAALSEDKGGAEMLGFADQAEPSAGEAPVAVRKEFADTAFWSDFLSTDSNGQAEVSFPMPENLGEWTARGWAFGPGAVVGENKAKIVTTKNLLVRLQAPRFFVEKDEVVLSGNIHNAFDKDKKVRAVLTLEGGTLAPMDALSRSVTVKAKGETRVDWRVKATGEGKAVVRMSALSDEESDAMQMEFPVYVHGMLKTESWSGAIRDGSNSAAIPLRIPEERRPEQTSLEIRWSPTLAGAMVDALPYLAAYPYGCTEQTLNRFLPAILTRRVLESNGIDLESIRVKRANLNAQERGDPQKRAEGWKRFPDNPVFDSKELDKLVRTGVARLADMQNGDGGWNWFPGWKGDSSAHLTAQIVQGFLIAKPCGVAVPDEVLQRGVDWLDRYAQKQIGLLNNAEAKKDNTPWKEQADNLDALVYNVLLEAGKDPAALRDYLYRDRVSLSLYGQGLLGLSLLKKGRQAELEMVLNNIGQFVEQDEENQTAWLRMNNGATWWFWFGDEIEAHAVYLKLLSRTAPKGQLASRVVKYLLNNRKHATYWNSTRDTAQCIEALAEYLTASGEGKPDMSVEVWLDGKSVSGPVSVTAGNLFTVDNTVTLEGALLAKGNHTVEVRRTGSGPVYFNAYLENFTLEDPITAAGLEVKVQRRLFKLTETDKSVKAGGAKGQAVDIKVDRYARRELKSGDRLKSGDLVEVELLLESKNDYEYLIVEDMKAAGFEPVDVRSGYTGNELEAYMEFRDERVCLFLRTLARGKHSVTYRVRAEIPGLFSVLPTRISGMYAPELRGNSDEQKIGITD
jgi:uncharacterized protein YfaS (alpha-2-macroglobulin family)